jgi:CO/xanthine dehydrogenase Mo-binding subunit
VIDIIVSAAAPANASFGVPGLRVRDLPMTADRFVR